MNAFVIVDFTMMELMRCVSHVIFLVWNVMEVPLKTAQIVILPLTMGLMFQLKNAFASRISFDLTSHAMIVIILALTALDRTETNARLAKILTSEFLILPIINANA